jgi:ATP-dependent DNA helicase RecG
VSEPSLAQIIRQGENMTVEFKSDRGPLTDDDLIQAVVCLANAQGGVLLVGVEDNGAVTGLHETHRTHPSQLAAFVASRTVPPLTISASFEDLPGGMQVAVLRVPAGLQPVATSDGRTLVRHLDARGQPACRPLYPHELLGWRADRG